MTTDGECDDQDSLRHFLLYANEFDIAGIVYSASSFHFQGSDDGTTLGDVTEEYLCASEEGDDTNSYRPQEMGWIESVVNDEYAVDYEYLSQNAEGYPTPEELAAVVKVGNVEFEGDVREDTEGSDLIKACILDDDERSLYIQSWGGFNTVARALLSIAEEYQDTDEWETIYNKICEKVVIQGHAQDTTWDNYIVDLYPDLTTMDTPYLGYGYFVSQLNLANVQEYFSGAWLSENIKFNHGELMANYNLIGDGTYYEGELDMYQMGMSTTVDWGSGAREFDQYDWLGEGDSPAWISLLQVGLRGLENSNYGTWAGRVLVDGECGSSSGDYKENNYITGKIDEAFNARRWLTAIQEDFAARADWAVSTYEECNHAPAVSAESLNITAAAGEVVELNGSATDPDGDSLNIKWWVYEDAEEYSGEMTELAVWDEDSVTTKFTVPTDAEDGDYFNIILEVTDNADAPMTRYAQVIVTVAS
ncbi:MAG: DUF1593 domain-containing protein [Clostridiales bacterium]|nr:DUF1593 domain-containing protein [Clostridiales bacterium]